VKKASSQEFHLAVAYTLLYALRLLLKMRLSSASFAIGATAIYRRVSSLPKTACGKACHVGSPGKVGAGDTAVRQVIDYFGR